ncbi:MAG: helix-turn-helix transcriptional regulator, partial [Aquisalinus sp.]|nr:helix-turn-helix transcriptional regulator [Aquisalinus sp.]
MPKVNPHILQWARETAGLSLAEAVRKLTLKEARGIPAIDRLIALEEGTDSPSRPMLVKMAKLYRRPLLTFYLPEVPKLGDRGKDFRTLPDTIDQTETALVDAVVRDVRIRQALVRASLEDADEAAPLPFIGSARRQDGVNAVVASISEILGFDRNAFRGINQLQGAFPYLRGITEAAGIFVLLIDNLGSHHTTIGVDVFRGFALADD